MKYLDDLNATIDVWIDALEQYTLPQLVAKPHPDEWSMGQVYNHLLEESEFFYCQVEACLKCEENSDGQMNAEGRKLFADNGFPDEKIRRGPALSDDVAQPHCKEDIRYQFHMLKDKLNAISVNIAVAKTTGKSMHPGFGYFGALDWFRYIEMHLRHHLRQKARLDEFLQSTISPTTSQSPR